MEIWMELQLSIEWIRNFLSLLICAGIFMDMNRRETL